MGLEYKTVVFKHHAAERMFMRKIARDYVIQVLNNGTLIEDYPDDTPYPSMLLLDYVANKPLHVVVAKNTEAEQAIVITAYWPDLDKWQPGFMRRRV